MPEEHKPSAGLDRNRAYYGDPESSHPGQLDYWQKMAAPRARVRRTLQVLRSRAPASVLDIGCGGGQLLREIRASLPGIRAGGCDLAAERIASNRQLLPEVAWLVGDVQDPATLSSVTEPFEAMVGLEVVEHLDDPHAFLRNAQQAVARDGFIFLSTQAGPLRATEEHVGHVQHFTRDTLSALLQECGWRPVRIWNEGFPFHDLSKWYANVKPEKTLAQFSDRPYGFFENAVCFALRQAFRLNSRWHGAQLYAIAEKDTSGLAD